jgi:hypothetical protein
MASSNASTPESCVARIYVRAREKGRLRADEGKKWLALPPKSASAEQTRAAPSMAGLGDNPVQVFRTGRAVYLEFLFLRLWTGFELPSSCINLPCYALNLNRNSLDFMRWPQIDLGAQDLNDIQRPKSFQKNS